MRYVAGIRGFLGLAAIMASLGVCASAAYADVIAPQHDPPQSDDGWQAGVCTSDTPECSIDTPAQFFRDAAGHPNVGFTQFIVANQTPGQTPTAHPKTIRVDLPVGLSVNPQATPQCEQTTFETNPSLCPSGSAVGTSFVTVSLLGVPQPPISATVYNIDPPSGEPARFGFNLLSSNVYLRADVAWAGDYHEGFTIDVPQFPLPTGAAVLKNRLVFDGRAGDGTFLTTPTTCFDPATAPYQHVYSTYLRADSYEEPDPNFPSGSPFIESPLPPGEKPLDCGNIPFDPSVGVTPNAIQTDSPAGPTVQVDLPNITGGANRASSHLKTAMVTLPLGMGLNPSSANGLEACTDAQFGKGTADPVSCPAASQIGTVSIQTPPLPPDALTGNVYLGQQLSDDPASGDEFRIFVDAESARYGISTRLIGHVSADPQTGTLTTTFADNPQVPFSSFQLHFNGGSTATLSTPDTCGPHTTTTALTPWSGNPDATPSDSFTLSSAPGGGSCPATLAERPFAPDYSVGPRDTQAGAFSPLDLHIARPDGAQELKRVDLQLPPGMLADLNGVSECPEAAIDAAAANTGAAEQASSSCPADSLVGSVSIDAGSGSQPFHVDGKAFLAGPYGGAPLSLAMVTPATAGPFDLGTVVVRVALFVDPDDAHVHAVSDPIPHVFGGVKLDIRSIDVAIDRSRFTLNPTSCDPQAITGALQGGGGDPSDPKAFSSFLVSSPFQASDCADVPFDPSISVDPGTQQTDSPAPATVDLHFPSDPTAPIVDSAVRTATVTLPPGMGLNPAAANGLEACTDAQFGRGTSNPVSCPAGSRIGSVSVETPILPPDSVTGNVYVGQPIDKDPASGKQFRIFVDAESAQYGISVRLLGAVSADPQTGRLTATFAENPQVPFSSFQLRFDQASKAPLTSPPTCGPNMTAAQLAPWSGNPPAKPTDSFDLTTAPGDGPCPKTLAERPFAPSFAAASLDKQGGAFTDFTMNLTRPDGAQEIKRVNVDLPPGLVAKLAGASYCPETELAAAATNTGTAEKALSSCPDQSFVGTVGIDAGAGPQPLHIDGRVYLAGPYKGAPISLVFVTPAVAGPYDLGTVVVRTALYLDPATAQVHAVSDPIPHVFGGVTLDLRKVVVDISREQFTLNPTNCNPKAVSGTLFGGGADPYDSATFSADSVSTPFQAIGCDRLQFGPKLFLRLFGHRKDFRRNGHPKLQAVLTARSGDANISHVAVTIPNAILLDQSHIRTVCTRDQFAVGACPADSVYGYAKAFTPLLDEPLSGPVYLIPEGNTLPDLVVALHGQVDFNLFGRTDTTPKGQLRSTFDAVPDVPVSKFVLGMQGGSKGLLVPSRNLCGRLFKAVAKIAAQNGKTANQRPKLRIPCRHHHRSRRHRD